MAWKQLTIASAGTLPDGLAEWLQEMGAISVTLEGDGAETLVERFHGDTPLWQEARITALFTEETNEAVVASALSDLGTGFSYDWSLLEDQDWERAWMDQFAPIPFGGRLWICPSWIDPPDPAAINLRLDPGMAFGTGTHHTTALCLDWLTSQELAGRLVVDYGCGSGILAVAALLLGCARACAVDNDVRALEATRVNAARNGVAGKKLGICLPGELLPVEADVVIANILAEPLIGLAPALIQLIRPGGKLLLSGLLSRQQEQVRAAYAASVEFTDCTIREDWVLLVGTRR